MRRGPNLEVSKRGVDDGRVRGLRLRVAVRVTQEVAAAEPRCVGDGRPGRQCRNL